MSYPIWSGINSHTLDDTEIDGAASTPGLVTTGFSSAIIPKHIGTYPDIYFEVLYARPERRSMRPVHETNVFVLAAEKRHIKTLPEVRFAGSDRSHKRYPYRRVK